MMIYSNKSSICNILLSCILILFLSNCDKPAEIPSHDLAHFVNPNIGSVHGRWFFYTPAAIPFGMAKLAPHTNAYNAPGAWLPAGYDDRHTSIKGSEPYLNYGFKESLLLRVSPLKKDN